MTIKTALSASTIAIGIGLGALAGMGTAAANPGQPCNAPGAPACQDQRDGQRQADGQNRGNAPIDWRQRGADQARQDHQPFNWNGQQVNPVRAGTGDGWGFWFLGQWIRL